MMPPSTEPKPAAAPADLRTLLHVFSTFGLGGPELRATAILGAMGRGFRHLLLAMDGDLSASAAIAADVDHELLPPPPRAGTLRTTAALTRLLRERAPDLVATYNWGAIEAVWAAHRAHVPVVHHEDGIAPDELVRRLRRRTWFRRWLLRAGPVVVPSQTLAAIARSEWGIAGSGLHVLQNGVDLDRFRPRVPAAARTDQPVTFGTVGGLRPEKDHANLLRALAEMPSNQARLILVGDGPLRSELQALARQLGLGERVEFAGARLDVTGLLHRFDVFVLSSRTEQMPIALLEAMASGLPVLATRVGDVPQMLPAEPGTLVAPEASAELAAAMTALANDPIRRQALGQRNRAHAERHHDAARRLPAFVALYAAMANRSPRRD